MVVATVVGGDGDVDTDVEGPQAEQVTGHSCLTSGSFGHAEAMTGSRREVEIIDRPDTLFKW